MSASCHLEYRPVSPLHAGRRTAAAAAAAATAVLLPADVFCCISKGAARWRIGGRLTAAVAAGACEIVNVSVCAHAHVRVRVYVCVYVCVCVHK